MGKKKSKDYIEVAKMCRQEGFSEEKVLKLCTPLCEDFRDKNYGASKDAHMPQTEDEITEDKLTDRDIFFYVLTKPFDESVMERAKLIDNIIKKPWFKGKIDMILDEVANFRVNGPKYKRILNESYFDGNKRIDSDIYTDMGIASSTFYEMRPIAIRLLGILMWKYVKRRCRQACVNGLPECRLIKRKRYPLEEEVLATVKQKAEEMNTQLKKNIAAWNHDIREWKGTSELRDKAERLSEKKLKLYDQYKGGKISKNTYMQMSEKLSAKQMGLADQLAKIDKKIYEANRNLAASVDIKTTLKEVRKLDSFDTTVLKKIIKCVKVYEDHIEYEWADFVK